MQSNLNLYLYDIDEIFNIQTILYNNNKIIINVSCGIRQVRSFGSHSKLGSQLAQVHHHSLLYLRFYLSFCLLCKPWICIPFSHKQYIQYIDESKHIHLWKVDCGIIKWALPYNYSFFMHQINSNMHPTHWHEMFVVLNDLKDFVFWIFIFISQITKFWICKYGTNMSLIDLVIWKLT